MKWTKLFIFALGIITTITLFNVISCEEDPEPSFPASGTITFSYEVPEVIFKYLEIEACWNNDEGTDIIHTPMLDNKFEITYNIQELPNTYPVIFMLRRTNRPIPDKLTGVCFDMEVKLDIKVGNHTIDEVYTNRYYIDDTHATDAIAAYMNDQRNSTYAVRIDKNFDIQYIAPQQRPIIFP